MCHDVKTEQTRNTCLNAMIFYMDNDTSSKKYSSVKSVASMRGVSWGNRQREIRMGYITVYIKINIKATTEYSSVVEKEGVRKWTTYIISLKHRFYKGGIVIERK